MQDFLLIKTYSLIEDDLAANVLEEKYIYNRDLIDIADNEGYSVEWVRKKYSKGMHEICL